MTIGKAGAGPCRGQRWSHWHREVGQGGRAARSACRHSWHRDSSVDSLEVSRSKDSVPLLGLSLMRALQGASGKDLLSFIALTFAALDLSSRFPDISFT